MLTLNRTLIAVIAALTVCAAVPAGASAAPCYSSTPTGNIIYDSASDSEYGLSPELSAMRVGIDTACTATFSYDVLGQAAPITGEFYSWFIDSDNSDYTGSQSGFLGADYAVGMLASGSAAISQWNGASMVTVGSISRTGTFAVSTSLSSINATPGLPIWVAGGASWQSSSGTSYFDFLPDVGYAWLGLTPSFSTTPPPSTGGGGGEAQCVVPKVRGYSVTYAKSRVKAAGCKVGSIKKRVSSRSNVGKAIGSSPAKGSHVVAGTKVTIYVGKRASRKRHSLSTTSSPDLITVRLNQLLDSAEE